MGGSREGEVDGLKKYLEGKIMFGDKLHKSNYFYCAAIRMAVPFTKKILA